MKKTRNNNVRGYAAVAIFLLTSKSSNRNSGGPIELLIKSTCIKMFGFRFT